MQFLVLILSTLLTVNVGFARDIAPQKAKSPILMLEKMNSNDIQKWSDKSSRGVECRELSDIKNTFLCLTGDGDQLRELMGRASYYVEAEPRHSILASNDRKFLDSDQAHYIGHDVMADDLKNFYKEITAACSKDKPMCATELESALLESVIAPAITKYPDNFVVIAAQAKVPELMGTTSHEILHARFFMSPEYQDVVREFWNEQVSADDRQKIEAFLADTYNFTGEKGELLLINEFQAYTLEDGSLAGEFERIAKAYGHELQKALGPLLPLRPDQQIPAKN